MEVESECQLGAHFLCLSKTVLSSPLVRWSSVQEAYQFAFGAQEPPRREDTEILRF